jgi:type IV pilus assembly protein PilM
VAKSKRILALDIGASKLVLAEFSAAPGQVPELLKYGIGYFGADVENETDLSAYIVSTVRDIMREQGIKKAPLIMSVSGQAVFPRFVKLPPVASDKVYQIVQYEAEQNVPFPINEVVWDYQLIEDPASQETNVMLVAVKTETVTRLTDCVVAADLEPEIVDVAPMALYNLVRFNYPDLEGCTMVLDIGSRSSNLIFIEDQRIFSRSMPVAGNAITQELMKEFEVGFEEAEALKKEHGFVAFGGVYAGPDSEIADRVSKVVRNVITRLHAEVNRSINFYRSQQGGSPPSLVLLCGGSSIIPHTDTFFREKLQIQVEYLNPFLSIAVGEGINAEQAGMDVHMLGEVAGLAVRKALQCPVEINLMPPNLVAKKTLRRRQPFFAVSAVGLVLILFCWWAYFAQARSIFKKRETFISGRIDQLTSDQQRLKSAQKDETAARENFEYLADLVEQRTRWVRIVEDIHGCMQDGMWLTAVRPMSADGENITDIEITGRGFSDKLKDNPSDTPLIEQFRNRLSSKSLFTDETKITYQPVQRAGAHTREFTILLNLKEPIKIR